MDILLQVRSLKTYFETPFGTVKAVDGVSFDIKRGEVLGLAGESGCGKTVTALSIIRVLPSESARIISGEIIFEGRDLLKLSEKKLREIRGKDIGMVFQEPLTSLNPLFSIGYQIAETIRIHERLTWNEALEKAIVLLKKVQIPQASKRIKDYPFVLSGGMRQRAMIAQAIACSPKLLIADEPTTALDVTIQSQILELFRQLKAKENLSILIITHDLGMIAQITDRVCIMYAGRIVESASAQSLFQNPKHPYTQGLLNSLPKALKGRKRLSVIPGSVPDLKDSPPGCSFHPRCKRMIDVCKKEVPPFLEVEKDHGVSCWRPI